MNLRPIALLLVLCCAPALTLAQAPVQHPMPAEAVEPMHEALKLLETLRVSNLEPAWRANAFARIARVLARQGDAEAARTTSNSALAALAEPAKRNAPPPPAAISPGVIYALLVQAHGELHDVEVTQKLAEAGFAALRGLPDLAIQANLLPYIAIGLADIGDRDGAGLAVIEGFRAAVRMPPGRDQIAALALIVIAQAKIGDRAEADATLQAGRQAAAAITDSTGRVYALAHMARAEAAVGNRDRARTLARDSALAYDRAGDDPSFTAAPRVTTLGLIAIAQAESGDRNAAHQTIRALQQTAAQLTQPYERFQALVSLVDTALLVDRGP